MGLSWIENIIEKELNLDSKKDIEGYGIDKFNEAARQNVLRYAEKLKKEWFCPWCGVLQKIQNIKPNIKIKY